MANGDSIQIPVSYHKTDAAVLIFYWQYRGQCLKRGGIYSIYSPLLMTIRVICSRILPAVKAIIFGQLDSTVVEQNYHREVVSYIYRMAQIVGTKSQGFATTSSTYCDQIRHKKKVVSLWVNQIIDGKSRCVYILCPIYISHIYIFENFDSKIFR